MDNDRGNANGNRVLYCIVYLIGTIVDASTHRITAWRSEQVWSEEQASPRKIADWLIFDLDVSENKYRACLHIVKYSTMIIIYLVVCYAHIMLLSTVDTIQQQNMLKELGQQTSGQAFTVERNPDSILVPTIQCNRELLLESALFVLYLGALVFY